MTQEDKSILFKDLCARLPYGVILSVTLKDKYDDIVNRNIELTEHNLSYITKASNWQEYKPYLRPMSSMTEEEKNNLQSLHDIISDENYEDGYSPSAWNAITEWEDYCNARHLDYRGLIPKGLALEASEGMYNIKEK